MRKRSPYGPFLERVAFPSIRIGSILLAVLAIGLGSWIETNDTMGDCSFKSSMSMHQVYLYRNISSNLTTPDSVSFGLWKHCYMYALNCSCTPTNLKYQPDVSTVLQTATTHLAAPPITTSTSLSRIIPLMLATVLGGFAFLIGLWANRRGKYIYRKIIVGLLLATLILVAYAFGSTYNQYYKMIQATCKSTSNTVYCAKDSAQIEVTLFSIALALLFIGLIFWFIASNFFKSVTPEEEEDNIEEKVAVSQWNFRKSATPQRKKRNQSNSEQDLTAHQYYSSGQQNDDLAVWRDAAMLDEDYYDNHSNDWEEQNDPFNNPVPLVQQQQKHYNHHSNNPHYRQQQKMKKEQQQRRSSGNMLRNNLTPPPPSQQQQQQQQQSPTSAENNYYSNSPNSPNSPRGHNKSRVTSSANHQSSRKQQQQRKSSANYATQPQDYNRPRNTTRNRKESNDSALTFGGANANANAGYQRQKSGKRRSSGRPLSELEPAYQPSQLYSNHTPTSISPHPFQYLPPNNGSRSSFALTPYYEEPLGYSSGGSSSSNGYFQQQQQQIGSSVPILAMPPGNLVEHPLNKKKIKDKRIQSYLQTTTPTTVSSSS